MRTYGSTVIILIVTIVSIVSVGWRFRRHTYSQKIMCNQEYVEKRHTNYVGGMTKWRDDTPKKKNTDNNLASAQYINIHMHIDIPTTIRIG